MTEQEPKLFTVQILLFGRPEVIVYNNVRTVMFGEDYLEIHNKDGFAKIRQSRIDIYEDTDGVE